MSTHVGLIRSINGIDYNYYHIPNIITLFPSYIHKDETNFILNSLQDNQNHQSIINCLSNEIIHSIYLSKHLKLHLNSSSINEISSKKGLFPTKHSTSFIAIINIGKSGPITFKNNKTNEKFTFTIDNGMMILINDINNDFTHNIHIDSFNEDQFETRYIITLTYN